MREFSFLLCSFSFAFDNSNSYSSNNLARHKTGSDGVGSWVQQLQVDGVGLSLES